MTTTIPQANIKVQSLYCTDVNSLRKCFNASFHEYFVPHQLSKEHFFDKLSTEAIDLKLSFGLFDNDDLVGFILFGIDIVGSIKIAYNAGIGILPEYRGYKLSYLLYQHGIEQLKANGVARILLEVIEQNAALIRVCQQMGFTTTRRLNTYCGKPVLHELVPVEIETLEAPNWDIVKNNCEWMPAWQYNMNCLKRAQSNYTLQVARHADETVAYCIANFDTGHIAHFGCSANEEKERYLSCLFNNVSAINQQHKTSIEHVDSNAMYANVFLLSIGLSRKYTCCEMELYL